MKLDTMAKKATAITAVITLAGSIIYASSFLWVISHAQYASADAVDYLLEKQIEVDIWRYEDEIANIQRKIDRYGDNIDDDDLLEAERRIEKLQRRLRRLENKLESLE